MKIHHNFCIKFVPFVIFKFFYYSLSSKSVELVRNLMAHGDAREGKWRGNWRMEWVASTLPTISERGISSITNADAHTSAASSRLNWCPHRFKWTRPFRRKAKSGFCACAITFRTSYTTDCCLGRVWSWPLTSLGAEVMKVWNYTSNSPIFSCFSWGKFIWI